MEADLIELMKCYLDFRAVTFSSASVCTVILAAEAAASSSNCSFFSQSSWKF